MKTTLEELQAFVAVVDGGSITAAADTLGQTVSGISRALARLEKKLDTTLLRRTTRRTELTEEGQAFLQRTRAILASIDDAEVERRFDDGILRKLWLSRDELLAQKAKLRSPMVLSCIEDHVAGKRFPLDMLNDMGQGFEE